MTNGDTPRDILAGVKVLDLSRDFAAPFCTMIMAELGADVIEVEHPETGDETRTWPPFKGDLSGYYASLQRSKRGIAVNLKHPEGVRLIKDLALEADVVIQNFTPGVADRLGLGPQELMGLNPRLVYLSVSGFGQTGPYRTKRGYDPILQAFSGVMSVTGDKGGPPVKVMMPIADLSTGIYAYAAIAGALFWRETSGRGQFIDLSMMDVMVAQLSILATRYLWSNWLPERSGSMNPMRVPSAAFECSDGEYIQLVPNRRQWARFCQVIGHPELADDPRYESNVARIENQDELYPILRKALKQKTRREWLEILEEAQVACAPINNLAQVFADPQVIAREMVGSFDYPGVGPVPGVNLPFRYEETPNRIRSHPPRLGEHTVEVLREMGRSDEEIEQMLREGAVRGLQDQPAEEEVPAT